MLYPDAEAFVGLWNSITNTHAAEWAACLAAACPAEEMPTAWTERLTDFQRLVVLRVLQPAKLVVAAEWLSARYVGGCVISHSISPETYLRRHTHTHTHTHIRVPDDTRQPAQAHGTDTRVYVHGACQRKPCTHARKR